MRNPNFFIVGAPKCGTTALSAYLSEHPDIFFCNPKEPHYFAEDLDQHRPIKDLESYLKLFEYAGPEHVAVGEGSVLYLYSSVALPNIRAFDPQAKIIVLLRKPADLVSSLHQQFLHALYEDEPDFEIAWNLQHLRERGEAIPRLCRQPELLLYDHIGSLASQVARLQSLFPPDQVKIILFDDFVADTAATYRDVLIFLGLSHDGRTKFRNINEAQALRPYFAPFIARTLPKRVRNLFTSMRFIPYLKPIPLLADRLLKKPQRRAPLNPVFYNELVSHFTDDVERLALLIDRDLSHWNRLKNTDQSADLKD